MAKVKNISGDDRTVPELGGLLVLAGQVVEVPDERLEGYIGQTAVWARADKAAKAAAGSED